jgi:hypothetical protein
VALAILVCVMTDDPGVVTLAVALQFMAGTFLATANAAASPLQESGESGHVSGAVNTSDASARRLILLKWLAALRVMLPALVLACLMCLMLKIRLDPGPFWGGLPILIGYMLASGSLAASLGVVLWSRMPRRGSPVVLAIAVWAVANVGFLAAGAGVSGGALRQGLSMSSPFSGVWALARAIGLRNLEPNQPFLWAIAWTVVLAVASAVLLIAALRGVARARSSFAQSRIRSSGDTAPDRERPAIALVGERVPS